MSNLLFGLIIFISFIILSIQRKLNSIPENLSSNIINDIKALLFILPEDKLITFNNSLINVTLYNTSDKYFSYNKMNINFENCLTILQKVYDLDPFFDYSNNDNDEVYKRCFFIIIKIEIDRRLIKDNKKYIINENYNEENIHKSNITKYPTNHIEYLIFNGKNGKLLNTSYCNDLNVKISHPIVNQTGININISKKFYKEYKIDVYRTNDSFFNDICMNFTSDKKTDLTLTQRREMYYQNASFCDSNCTYIEINYTSNTAICACEIKDGIMNDEILFSYGEENQHNKSFLYNNVFSIINYKVFKCYKQVFNGKRLSVNIGNYTSLVIIILYTICIIHFYRNRKRNVMVYFQKEKLKANEEKIKNGNNKNKENEKNERNDGNDNDDNEIDNNFKDNYEGDKKNKNKSININGIIISDISNPIKKNKIKLSKDDENNNTSNNNIYKNKGIDLITKSNNDTTKETNKNSLKYKYGELKIDTGEELLDGKNNEKDWNDIISIKRKNSKKKNHKKEIQIKSSSLLTSTKNNTIKTNDKRLEKSNASFLISKANNYIDNYNYNYLFPSSNFSVEIPISNIMPAFFKSKKLKVSSISPEKSNSKDLSSSHHSNNNLIIRRSKTKYGNAVYNNFINKNDKVCENENSDDNVNQNYICVDTEDVNKNKFTLRRSKECFRNKRTKDRKNKNSSNNESIKRNSKKSNLLIDFDDMKFEIAILIDNRNFCNKFKCELKESSIIILLFFRDDLMFKQIKLSIFILSCTLDYFFNAFLYSDIYLQQEYDSEKLISVLIDYPKEVLSSLAAQFFVKLIELLMEDKTLSLFIKRITSQNKNYLKGVNYLLKQYEKRFYIYITISYLILVLAWYYTCAFCTVYQNTQLNLLYDTIQSTVLNLILPFPICFLSVFFRHLAIKKLNKFLFFISNILRIFI